MRNFSPLPGLGFDGGSDGSSSMELTLKVPSREGAAEAPALLCTSGRVIKGRDR